MCQVRHVLFPRWLVHPERGLMSAWARAVAHWRNCPHHATVRAWKAIVLRRLQVLDLVCNIFGGTRGSHQLYRR